MTYKKAGYSMQDFINSLDSNRLIYTVDSILKQVESYLPRSLNFASAFQAGLLLILLILVSGFILRMFFGHRCILNRAISASVGILFIYIITVIVYSFNPWSLSRYLSPLPFALFRKDLLILVPYHGTEITFLCSHFLSLTVLCFIVHLLDTLLPRGNSTFTWCFIRCISIILAIFLNLAANYFLTALVPYDILAYAPAIVLALLAAAILIGLFNPVLCILFTVANPLVGFLYTFFFSNLIGKQVTKSVLSAGIICCIFYVAEFLGYTVLIITSSSLAVYLPLGIILLLIWWIFDYKL